MGDNSDKKKNTDHLFYHEESIYEFSKHGIYTVLNFCFAHESNKWPEIAKGHNSNKISLNWLKI